MTELDAFDRKILRVLQDDGKISNHDLAERVGLSLSPCFRRVKALEERGIIRGYRAIVDAMQVELGLMALVQISMDKHTAEKFSSFEKQVKAIPEVLECLLITGQTADYQLKVIVKDLEEYQQLLLHKITKIPGVSGIHSSFVLRKVIDKTSLPL